MVKVVIKENAFLMMVSSAAEVFHQECYGMLVGRRYKKDYVVDLAIPHQSTDRSSWGVAVDDDAEHRLIRTMNFLKGYQYIGEYHSHPKGGCGLSEYDIADLRESGAGISMLVVIEKAKRYKPWKYVASDKCLTGTIGNFFKITIKGYVCNHPSKRILKLPLRCEYLKKLNQKVKKRQKGYFLY